MPDDLEASKKRTDRWLIGRFGSYYASNEPQLPPRYTKREWAFLFFGQSWMARHMGFPRRSELLGYVREQVPQHAYYSTAYYEEPSAKTMVDKGWQGATLVFDLDADHLEGASEMSYRDMLAAVKVEFIKLVDRWLCDKLGFDVDDVGIVFSGGRGYHAHVEDPRVLELNAFERREIIDLVTGKADLKDFLGTETIRAGVRRDGRGYSSRARVLPDPARGDWRGDLAAETLRLFKRLDDDLRSEKREAVVSELAALAEMDEGVAGEFVDLLEQRDDSGRRRIDRLLSDRRIDLQQGLGDSFWNRIAEKLFVSMRGEADEPVTADIKRLIRLPGSLHGKTGFRVMELTRDQLDDFEPLEDALAFGSEQVTVEPFSDAEVDLGGQVHSLEAGRRIGLPEEAAVFACLRGMAAIPPD